MISENQEMKYKILKVCDINLNTEDLSSVSAIIDLLYEQIPSYSSMNLSYEDIDLFLFLICSSG
jgi:hypothetical protein